MGQIILNGNPFEIDKSLSVKELLVLKKYSFPNLLVRINGELIKKDIYESAIIKVNDNVQVIHMISGG